MDEPRKRKLNDSTNCDDDYHVLTKKPTYANGAGGQQRIIGPAHPSSATYTEETSFIDNDDDSDSDEDDDDIGPTFPPAEYEQPQFDNKANSGSYKNPEMSSDEQQGFMDKNQRDEWMLRPPEGSDWTSRVDPTKLRHRKFQTGKSARAPSVASRMDASWIENPEQKMERIKDEMMGVKNPADTVNNESPGAETPRITEAVKARIQKYNVSNWLMARLPPQFTLIYC